MASNLLPLDCGMPAVGLGCAWREEGERGTSERSFQALTILLHLAPHIRGAFSFTLDVKRELAAAVSIVPPGLAISVVMVLFGCALGRGRAHIHNLVLLGRELSRPGGPAAAPPGASQCGARRRADAGAEQLLLRPAGMESSPACTDPVTSIAAVTAAIEASFFIVAFFLLSNYNYRRSHFIAAMRGSAANTRHQIDSSIGRFGRPMSTPNAGG
jgi:hypothetical protein